MGDKAGVRQHHCKLLQESCSSLALASGACKHVGCFVFTCSGMQAVASVLKCCLLQAGVPQTPRQHVPRQCISFIAASSDHSAGPSPP